jgi:3-hydroxyacyl-[acyl-carrier-protein] dehydratase
MNIEEIMRTIPHRPPFLFVDRIVECVPGSLIRGEKNISSNYGDRDLQSPLVVIEAIAQVAVILASRSLDVEPKPGDLFFFAGIEHAQFLGTPRAGDQLQMVAHVKRIRRGIGWFRGIASVDGRELVIVTMQAAFKTRTLQRAL